MRQDPKVTALPFKVKTALEPDSFDDAARGLREMPRLLTARIAIPESNPPAPPKPPRLIIALASLLQAIKKVPETLSNLVGKFATVVILAATLFYLYIPCAIAWFFMEIAGSWVKKYEPVLEQMRPGRKEKPKEDLSSLVDVPVQIENWMNLISRTEEITKIYPGAPSSCTVLLHGPTGVGKTACLRALCAAYKYELTSIASSTLKDKFMGESEKKIAEIFKKAREDALRTKRPVVLFFDELDTLFADRESEGSSNVRGFEASILGEFLVNMDGLAGDNKNVFVAASTNRPQGLDAALASRFSSSIDFKTPAIQQRAHFFRDRLEKYQHNLSFDEQKALVVATENMSYRELDKTVLLGGAHAAIADGRTVVCAKDLLVVANAWQTTRQNNLDKKQQDSKNRMLQLIK